MQHLQEEFLTPREEYQLMHGRDIEETIKSNPETFFGYVDLKKERVSYPSIMHQG
jgi:hypothetical protein